MTDQSTLITVAVIGGTGKEGAGLAARLAQSGYRVIIGSRDEQRAQKKADELNTQMGFSYLRGMENQSAAEQADIIIISVPYDSHSAILEALCDVIKDKIVIDVVLPLNPANIRTVNIPESKSAAQEAQAILGSEAKVVAAFHNVGYKHLYDRNHAIACDILVCSDDEQAKEEVIKLSKAIGLRGLDAGPLANAVAVEAMTSVLLYIDKRYKVKNGAGIVITGIEQEPR